MQTGIRRQQQPQVYPGYDLDVKQRVTRVQKREAKISAQDRSKVLLTLVVAGIVAIGFIVAAAYGAAINYQNNSLKSQNASLQNEVELLEIQIESACNVATIQSKAIQELGMQFPTDEQLVQLSTTTLEGESAAALQ